MQPASVIPFPDLLQRLARDGIRLWLDAGRLRYSAPRGASIPDLMPSLREHRAALCGMLAAGESPPNRFHPTFTDNVAPTVVPLSTMQRGMVDVYPKLSVAHYLHPTVTSVFEGVLNLDALRASLRTVMARHSALRSRVSVNDTGEAMALIEGEVACDLRHMSMRAPIAIDSAPAVAIEAAVADAPAGPPADAAALRFAQCLITERFDLDRAPLIRIGIISVAPTLHVLVVVAHHAIMDGLSLSLLLQELSIVYSRLSQGKSATQEPVKLQFTDFVRHEREWLRGAEALAAREYWKKRIENLSRPFDLPSASRDSSAAAPHAQLRGEISSGVTEALRQIARNESTTFRCAALAAFVALLGRWRNSTEVCTWVCHPGRARPDLYNAIGCFYNLWLLRVDLEADPTFVQLLRQVHEAHIEALPWLELPFTEIGELLGNPSNNIIFSHLLEDSDDHARPSETLRGGPAPQAADRARAEALAQAVPAVAHLEEVSRQSFSLACVERARGVSWSILHAPSLVDCGTMTSMNHGYARLLASVATEPTLRLSRLPLS